MAMLAGPRRKQKVINLRAKNNAWSNDNTKFGQRMLEKMGWSSGKGLGARENGIVEHVVARYKNDEKGLGFEDKNDQWTKHEDDFNALLANLSNAEGNEEKLHSGVSLEVKSKKSKARVHYHKFTRGKDLTRYSAKDLANIFGKKSLKEEEKTEEILQEDVKTAEQVFTEKGSMEDYFKSKLANFKTKTLLMNSQNETDDNAEYAFKGFSTYSDQNESEDHQGFGFSFCNHSTTSKASDHENGNADLLETSENLDVTVKSKKKKKKNKNKDHALEESNNCESGDVSIENTDEISSCIQDNIVEQKSKSEKKSKKKKKISEESVQNDRLEEFVSKKKKSKANRDEDNICTLESSQVTQEIEQENYVPKKKKKRKNKDTNE